MSTSVTRGHVVLIVDANSDRIARVRAALADLPVALEFHSSPALIKGSFAFACISLSEPATNAEGLSFIRTLQKSGVPTIAYGAHIQDWEISARCLPLLAGAGDLLDSEAKDFEAELRERVGSLLQGITSREAEEKELNASMRSVGIYAGSTKMLELFRLLSRFSRLSDLPTLITGETGTGKEKFARALHQLDPRRAKGPFVPVNCGALSATLAESELFGHRRGAFTGADRDRRGLLRAAQGGVLFLDEVGELPEAIQTKLLRVLQEGMVLTVGEEREEAIDVRIVAATNRELAADVGQGKFRADLFHRLNVLQLHIPPLRERREDVRPLVSYFVETHSAFSLPCPRLVDETMEALERLELPGNVRQLENIICRALVNRAAPALLQLRDLPVDVLMEVAARASQPLHVPSSDGPEELEAQVRVQFERLIDLTRGRLDQSMDFCERILISVALDRTRGNQSETARLLQITPRSVYNKLRRHHLESPRTQDSNEPEKNFRPGK